jgi:glycogen operon protein
LRDLVTYDQKHNEANGEQNRDGHQHNLSWNCGVEGSTEDSDVLQLRARLQRALMATLFFSQGTPMLLAGDDIGHSQLGNNNAYCQDNAVCWLDWQRADHALAAFTGKLTALRRRYRALRRPSWYNGAVQADGHPDITWMKADGGALDQAAWSDSGHCIGIRMSAEMDGQAGDETCLLLVNAEPQAVAFTLPPGTWRALMNSAFPDLPPHAASAKVEVPAHALLLLAMPWT